MDQAWLDSLSEDWLSEPRSPTDSNLEMPNTNTRQLNSSTRSSTSISRIPIAKSRTSSAVHKQSALPLGERSPSINNISPAKPRRLSALQNERGRGRKISRTLSASTTSSAQHDTVQKKSVSSSPDKNRRSQEIPDWKRRLLHGDVAYGEKCDLFSPVGLEKLFSRPPTQNPPASKENMPNHESEINFPSSPPSFLHTRPTAQQIGEKVGQGPAWPTLEEEDEDSLAHPEGLEGLVLEREQLQPSNGRRGPRTMSYRMVDTMSSQDFSENDLSQGSNFLLDKALQTSARRNPGSDGRERSNSTPGRIVSGQSNQSNTTRDEGLTPIFLSRRDTNAGFEYAALDLATSTQLDPEELRNRLRDFDTGDEPSLLLPGETRDTTEDFAHNGYFVNTGRGGRSAEGSFRRRPLSLSSLTPIDEASPHTAAPQAPQIPKIRMVEPSSVVDADESSLFNSVPRTSRSPSPDGVDKAKTNSGVSQLKIFGHHDTFTSKKLQRRLSQYEDTLQETGLADDECTASPDGKSNAKVMGDASGTGSPGKKPKRISNFGEGDLDDFDFSDVAPGSNGEANTWRNNISEFRWNEKTEEKEIHTEQAVTQKLMKQKTLKIWTEQIGDAENSSRPYSSSSAESKFSGQKETLDTPRKPRNGDVDGKRLRISPYKDPTPKRRRTLMPAEASDVSSAKDQSVKEQQSAMSRKRKDARHQDDQQHADPNVIASRQILRPRTASRGYSSADPNSRPNSQGSELSNDQRLDLEEQTKQLAETRTEMDSNVPDRPLNPFGHFPHLQGNRKASITTQDYLDDAKKIMAAIREKARPRSAMTSNESESENAPGQSCAVAYEDSDEESTPEAFERPPSREGNRPVPRVPYKQEDPEILKHLEKYQEKAGVEDVIASSMKQLSIARAATKMAKDAERAASATISRIAATRSSIFTAEIIESDPPNIIFSESPALQRKRKHDTSETNPGEDPDALVQSQGSSGSSSFPSGSSRGSERHTLAPDRVGHLIPEQVCGMVYDRQRNIWFKPKVSVMEHRNPLPSEDTDDDPFGDIPDLSVDETQEILRMKAARKREELKSDPMPPVEEVSEEESKGFKRQGSDADLEEISAEQFSRAQSDRIISAAAAVASETPQRSLAVDDEESILTNPYQSPEMPLNNVAGHTQNGDRTNKDALNRVTAMITELKARAVEPKLPESSPQQVENTKQDLTFDDGHTTTTPKPVRNVTIQFSSPIASIIKDVAFETSFNDEWDEDGQLYQDSLIKNRRRNSNPSLTRPGSARKSSLKVRSAFQPPPHRIASTGNSAFPLRQVSTINEQDEVSLIRRLTPETNAGSVGLINQPSPAISPTTPDQLQVSQTRTPSNGHHVDLRFDASLNLTPLSEFTIHRRDQSLELEVSYLSQRRHHEPSTKSRTLSVTVHQLVEKLTDVEPYEPYWEHMKEVELRNKALSSLHMLEEFCGALVELDVSNNKIDQIDGVPASVRHFKISHNSISDLTSWGHLINLQYVDVSNNDLTSLRGFKHLVHLRSLRADNNSVTSLDGVMNLDGLLSLRLRGNQLETVDFMDTALQRLTDLDLKGNGLTTISNIHELKSLTVLNLEENELEIFSSPPQGMFFSLKYLKLSGNRISRINVSRYPNLRLLYLDRNCLGKVTGLFKTKYLDSLSLREQRDGNVLDMTFLDEVYEIRKLFLSGNLLPSFNPRADFLNLQLLELANCGLQSLPPTFGQMMANLRVLNLNFNALRELSPLLGIVRLKKLHLAGNRFAKLRMTAGVLSQFSSLSKLDIRNNPVTQGFYPTALEKKICFQEGEEEEIGGGGDVMDAAEPFTLGMADQGLDVRYRARLDLETRLLRRVYEMWILDGCRRLKVLDGLGVDRSVLGIRDETWEALVKAGVLRARDERDGEGQHEENCDAEAETQILPSHPRENTNTQSHGVQNGDTSINQPPSAIRDCDTPRPSIERDDTTDSNSVIHNNIETGDENRERLDTESGSKNSAASSSSIWGAEDSFA